MERHGELERETEEGYELASVFRGAGGVDSANTNPDGSVNISSRGGRRVTAGIVRIPQEPICGVDPMVAFMYSSNQLSVRERVESGSTTSVPDMVQIFRTIDPGTSLAELERAAKTSNSKMLQLADCLMVGLHGWPRDPQRACDLFRAAACGCTEEELQYIGGIPVGDPKAMIASANLAVTQLKSLCGYTVSENCPFHEWISKGLADDMRFLREVFKWTADAVRLHGHVTSLTLMIGSTIKEMNLINDRRVSGDRVFQVLCEILLQASEYREKQMQIVKMQEKGKLPRGDPSDAVIQSFKPKAIEIFQSLPKKDDAIHIEFKQVPRPPFPMVVISYIPSTRKVVKIVRLGESLQLTPFSMEAFQHVWLRIAFDIHLGRLGTNERCRPKAFTVLDDGHGNKAFATYLREQLRGCDTEVRLVTQADTVKTGRRTRSTYSDLSQEMMELFLEIPGFMIDAESSDDVVARAQEDYVDRIISRRESENESDDDALHSQAEQMKQRGNEYFQSQDFNSAVRCYSLALGHMRRIIKHNQTTYKLLGTTLSNRAACFLGLLDGQQVHSIEFRKVYARNAINDCTTALESTWASSALPSGIIGKLRFRRDKATASYDSLSNGDFLVAGALSSNGHEDDGNREITQPIAETSVEEIQQANPKKVTLPSDTVDLLVECGEVLFESHLAKNAKDGCPICLREFNGELLRSYSTVLPCGEHALCANCTCTLKVEADKAKQCPQCPLCRYSFDGDFIEGVPSVLIEKDQELASLILQLPDMEHDEKIAVAERLLWTHRFEVSAVVDALEALLDGRVSGLFFRSDGDLTHEQKDGIYRKARQPVLKLEEELKQLLEEQRLIFDSKSLSKICSHIRKVRKELAAAREKAREEVYSRCNTVGAMGAETEGGTITVDYHGLHVSEMRMKFKDHILSILPAVGKVTVITGRGRHSVGKESKLKKALFKLIGEYENLYWQKIEGNDGAVLVFWRTKNGN
eukprot:scaffold4786_cov142-Skeletonema_dohrnii-CCMP3373.AAC.3